MPMLARKEEYRPSYEEVADRLLETEDFRAQLIAFLAASEGHPRWAEEAVKTFTQQTRQYASRAEDHLINEHFDQKDY